jgi:hypothetical protein
MFGIPLTFAAPLVLAGLLALPAIWLLLRVTPPRPRRIAFPPLAIFRDLMARRETPARTPWWLLALRLAIAALLILAAAGPVLNPTPALLGAADQPVLMMVDNGATAAHDWRDRSAIMIEQGEAIARDGRSMAVLALAQPAPELQLLAPAAALEALRAIRPAPHLAERSTSLDAIGRFLQAHPGTEIVWISDGAGHVSADDASQDFSAALAARADGHAFTIFRAERAPALALAGAQNTASGLSATVLRAEPNGRNAGDLRAVDLRGLTLAERPFAFDGAEIETQVRFELPMELRNAVSRIEVVGEGSAGAVSLIDERSRRKRVGIVSGTGIDQAQPLLAPTFYIERALGPYADIREARGSAAESVSRMLDEQISVLVLADVGQLERETQIRIIDFVESGGLLLRFAGPRLSTGTDELVPVRLRSGGRNLGGALSWDAPRTFAPFTRESPFYGLPVPDDLGITRQILAEPDGDLTEKTWAALEDGTPIVTADRRGDGMIVLFHVTADASWSNLPLTGLFVDMLRNTIQFAGAPDGAAMESDAAARQPVSPRIVLDGLGNFISPPANARPVTRAYDGRASFDHPPGFYGPADSSLAVNALTSADRLTPLDISALTAQIAALTRAETVDLRAPLFVAALALLLVDTLLAIILSGHLAALMGRVRRTGAATGALALAAALAFDPSSATAQTRNDAPLSLQDIEAAMVTRLAYVITEDAQVDAASLAGLSGLSMMLANRTALEPGAAVGVDVENDELAFFPILYWPIVASRPQPSQEAIRRLDEYMKNGGTVIFDTRDALQARPGGPPTPEGDYLRRMLSTLDIPPLEPLPPDHVLTKTFYILDNLPGRYERGETWVEAIPPAMLDDDANRPARAGDGVSPLIITSNDLASAWAVGQRGEALYPLSGRSPRQREMAFRGGINIVMYALTGNYKADQVHIPALLERLGN